MMRTALATIVALLLGACRPSPPPAAADTSDARWWAHVQALAADSMEGRKTGTPGYDKAAEYVANAFATEQLQPLGTTGYLQPISFESRRLVEPRSTIAIRRGAKTTTIEFGRQAIAFPLGSPGKIAAEMVFVGYAMTIPDYGYDDFRGLDLTGKIAVFLQGAPANVPSLVAAHYSSLEEKMHNLAAHRAAGGLMIWNPRLAEAPWDRLAAIRSQFTQVMDLTEPGLGIGGDLKVTATFDSREAGVLFDGSSIALARVLEADAARQPLPHGPLTGTVVADMVAERSSATASNVVALLPGRDASLNDEYILLSAHLDHTGIGDSVNGDRIYNGAMDNASGVATLLDIAHLLRERGAQPRRSIVFLACTGEEEGLLGSKFFAARPTVPLTKVAANINLDMFLPIIPMRTVRGYGVGESSLAAELAAAAQRLGLAVQDDPQPERNLFIRSDQYSFIKKGIPALFLTVGYDPKSAEEMTVNDWLSSRYHGPSDDTMQPIDHETAARFNQLMVGLSLQLANADRRPEWNGNSFFRRFTQTRPD